MYYLYIYRSSHYVIKILIHLPRLQSCVYDLVYTSVKGKTALSALMMLQPPVVHDGLQGHATTRTSFVKRGSYRVG